MATSNAVTPAFASQKPSPVFQQTFGAVPQESLADGIGSSYPIIRYTGKVWSISHRGEKKVFLRPDDGSPASYIDVIILRQADHKSKSYYPKYEEGSDSPPICSSLDGVIPDDNVPQKQATACGVCPRNVWFTAPDGTKKRECADFKRLAVLLLPTQTKAMFGTPLMEPAFLRVPGASLNDLANFGERMNTMGWHYCSYITRISFDPTKSFPKFVFEAVKGLTDAEAPVVLPLREDANSLRITGEDKVSAISGAAKPIAVPQIAMEHPPQQYTTVSLTPQAAVAEARADALKTPAPVDSGLLDLTPTLPGATPPVASTKVDVGETVESDAALDAKISALLSS